ncbi:MAG: sporulation integral membrane protein YtvI [Oscillospiraceae bacterium]|nr:sporulation integral membrane protein YtvI [Oscillospiraceae bacterium]
MTTKHAKTVINLIFYIVGILLLCIFVPKLLRFFMPFVIGWIIALIANPLVRFFEKRFKIVRKHGSLVVIVGVLALVITGCYFLIAWIVREGIDFVKSIPHAYVQAQRGFRDIAENLSGLFSILPADLQASITEIAVNIDTYFGELIGTIGGPTLSFAGVIASEIPNLLVMTIFMLLSAYFFVADKERISAALRSIMPQSAVDQWNWLKEIFSRAVGGYFVAQFKIMGVIATILFIGFMILDIDHAILWALLIAFLDFIPFLGTGTAIWPWAAFQLLSGNFYMAAGLMIIYVICLLVHQLLQPKFVGDTVGMDSLTTLIFMFIGYRFSSVFGMIIAVPIGITVINLCRAGAFDKVLGDVRELVRDFNAYRKS